MRGSHRDGRDCHWEGRTARLARSLGTQENGLLRRCGLAGAPRTQARREEPVTFAAKPAHARMVQKDKTFSPHVLAIPVGANVEFPNFDPIFHNAFSNYDGKTFDLGLYAPGTSKSVVFSRPGIVRVFCNIHATMSAVIAVLETPYFDVSKPNGSFEIAGRSRGRLPPPRLS